MSSIHTEDIKSTQPSEAPGQGRRLQGMALTSVIIALLLTLLLEALDQTIVGTAMPKIIGELQGFDRYTWVITAYLLTSTTLVPIIGKLSDQFGRKWFLIIGVVIFLSGSVLAGASLTMNQLIAFRALQGLGAGVGLALVNTVIADIFPPVERAKWQSAFGAVYGFSNLIGPTFGGWLTDHGPLVGTLVTDSTRWRWVFYINLPVGLIALTALFVFLPSNISIRSSSETGWAAVRRIDFTGAILASAATICLLLGLTWGGDQGDWGSPLVIAMLAGAVVLFVLFIIMERFAAEPILPLGLFRNQVFSADLILSLLQMMILLGVSLYMPLYMQGILGLSATAAGAAMTPMSVMMVVGAMVGGMLIARLQRYQVIAIVGALIMCIGIFLLTRISAATALPETIFYMVVMGLGTGTFFSLLNIVVQNALPRTQLGVGTAAVRYLGQLGATLGVAIVGTVVNSSLSSDLANRIPATTVQQLTPAGVKAATNTQILINPQYHDAVVQTAKDMAAKHAAAQVPAGPQHDQLVASVMAQTAHYAQQMLDQVVAALKLSLMVALQHGFLVVLVFAVFALITTLFLKDVPMVQAPATENAQEEDMASVH
jgi:EmrB/QacA subfamily drug resistance transporter